MMPSLKEFSEVTKFHGHVCPGSALGYMASKAALKNIYGNKAMDEEIVAIVENDSCAVDAVQVLTGCTAGKGNLIFKDYGKQSYTFLNRDTGKGVRVILKCSFDVNKLEPKLNSLRDKINSGAATGEEKKELKVLVERASQKILEMPLTELFHIEDVKIDLPPKARLFKSIECAECGEMVSEHRARVKSGKIVCIPCNNMD